MTNPAPAAQPTAPQRVALGHHATRWDRDISDDEFVKHACFGDSKVPCAKQSDSMDFASDFILIKEADGSVKTHQKYGTELISRPEIKNPHAFFKELWQRPRTRVMIHVPINALYDEFIKQLFDQSGDLSMCESLTLIYLCGALEEIGTAVELVDGSVTMFDKPYTRDSLALLIHVRLPTSTLETSRCLARKNRQ